MEYISQKVAAYGQFVLVLTMTRAIKMVKIFWIYSKNVVRGGRYRFSGKNPHAERQIIKLSMYWVTQKLPQIYTANHATFPI